MHSLCCLCVSFSTTDKKHVSTTNNTILSTTVLQFYNQYSSTTSEYYIQNTRKVSYWLIAFPFGFGRNRFPGGKHFLIVSLKLDPAYRAVKTFVVVPQIFLWTRVRVRTNRNRTQYWIKCQSWLFHLLIPVALCFNVTVEIQIRPYGYYALTVYNC